MTKRSVLFSVAALVGVVAIVGVTMGHSIHAQQDDSYMSPRTPWGDPDFDGDVAKGLPAVRDKWIRDRADVEEYDGREAKPLDNGYLSDVHADHATQRDKANRLTEFPGLGRRPLRASAGHPVTQYWYAKQGIITPEMEHIAIRENMGLAKRLSLIHI